MKKIFSIVMIIALCFSLVGCGKDNKDNNNKETDNKIILTDIEQKIFNKVISVDFYDQTSVKILGGYIFYGTGNSEIQHTLENVSAYYIKLQATNKAGGTITKCYNSSEFDNFKSLTEQNELDRCDYAIYKTSKTVDEINVAKMNKYFKQHWENLGLD